MKPSEAPIILIHNGNSWYLPYTIWQLKKTNHDTPIYLLGDKSTKHLKHWINHVDVVQFASSVELLRKVYRHKSIHGVQFEFTCILRWFILLDFMKKYQLDNCIYLDSDILVYDDLNIVVKDFPNFDMTWCGYSAHTNFIKSRKALENYCDNVIQSYSGEIPLKLQKKSLFQQVMSGEVETNISDMTFWKDYDFRYPNSLLDISIPNEKGTFDRSMEDTRVFEEGVFGFKKIYWKSRKPFCKEIESGKLFPFISLHFQGKGKGILKNHFKERFGFKFFCLLFNNTLQIVLSKILNRINGK